LSIQIIKLSSSETLVTEVLKETEDYMMLLNPLEIRTEHTGRSRGSLIALQWLPMFEEENKVAIQKLHVVGIASASDEIIEYYINAIDNILNPDKLYERAKNDEELLDKLTDPANYANTNSTMIH
jgi:hypothetical protein